MRQMRRNPVLRSVRVLAKLLAVLAPVGIGLSFLVGVVVYAFTTFATLAYVDAKDAAQEGAIARLVSAIERIDNRTWEAWGKPRGEPEPPRQPAGK